MYYEYWIVLLKMVKLPILAYVYFITIKKINQQLGEFCSIVIVMNNAHIHFSLLIFKWLTEIAEELNSL